MQLKWSVMLCAGMLGGVALNAQADNQVYQGKWLGKNAGASLQLDKSGAQFTVNGQTFKDSTPEFFISKLNNQTFLYVNATDANDKQREHRLYLLCDTDPNTARQQQIVKHNLMGYYDIASINQNQTADLQSTTIQFSQESQPAVAMQTAAVSTVLR